jgi:thioredoxin-related protein
MKVKLYILLIFVINSLQSVSAQENKVNWMTWDQALEKSKETHHKIMIHIYTEGCTPCKSMDLTTFASPQVAQMINNNFYAVKLDAKSKKELMLNGKKLAYKCESGACYHELSMELTNGSLSFPSVVFLDEEFNNIGAVPDYKDAKQFGLYVEYYAGGYSSKMTFKRFEEMKKRKNSTHHK